MVLIAQAPAQPVPVRRRWSPSRDVDPVKVERALSGDTVIAEQLGPAERVAAIRAAASEYQLTDSEIAERLGMTPRSIVRARTRHHIPPAVPANYNKGAA